MVYPRFKKIDHKITSREKPLANVSKNAWEKSVTSEEKNPEDTGALA